MAHDVVAQDEPVTVLLESDVACACRAAHETRVDDLLRNHLGRRSRGEKHPVEDFLFTYYRYRPSSLRRWHPGLGTTVTGPAAAWFEGWSGYTVTSAGASVDAAYVERTAGSVRGVRDLLVATAARPASFGCFGLHEWAMVYRAAADDVRHPDFPLRLGRAGTNEVVESHRVGCTHYDAFRFFADDARPLNAVQPTRATQIDLDQPGCVHASMDLYGRFAVSLIPLIPSELVVDCFEFALELRYIDMRASPYDLSSLGLEPIRIETAAGKAEFTGHQRRMAARGADLRRELIGWCDRALFFGHSAEDASSGVRDL